MTSWYSKPGIEVLIPQHLTKSGVGIGWTYNGGDVDLTFWVLCPGCPGFLTYQNGRDPDLICEGCRKRWVSFPGIPSEQLNHKGPRFQVFQTSSSEAMSEKDDGEILGMIDDWIELWTGLTGIEISITV
jgi:hypothetical protein